MIQRLDDHDPRALRGFALVAERAGDADTARVLRAAADQIERLTEVVAAMHGQAKITYQPFG